jgi:histidine triad (HIT) family protein
MNDHCIFCGIVNRQVPAEILFEDEQFIAFKDIHPMAPVHILIIPRLHLDSLNDAQEKHASMLGDLLLCAQNIARSQNLSENGFRLMLNTGKDGGQTVPHLHIHLLGGKPHLPVQVG